MDERSLQQHIVSSDEEQLRKLSSITTSNPSTTSESDGIFDEEVLDSVVCGIFLGRLAKQTVSICLGGETNRRSNRFELVPNFLWNFSADVDVMPLCSTQMRDGTSRLQPLKQLVAMIASPCVVVATSFFSKSEVGKCWSRVLNGCAFFYVVDNFHGPLTLVGRVYPRKGERHDRAILWSLTECIVICCLMQ